MSMTAHDFAGLQEDEAVEKSAIPPLTGRVVPIVIDEILVHSDDETVAPDGVVNDGWVLATAHAKIARRVHMRLRGEAIFKVVFTATFVEKYALFRHRHPLAEVLFQSHRKQVAQPETGPSENRFIFSLQLTSEYIESQDFRIDAYPPCQLTQA